MLFDLPKNVKMSVKDWKWGEIPDLLFKDIDNLPKMLREDIPFSDI